MSSTITANMGLVVPGVGTENSPQWSTDINASLSSIDSHNHSSGQGVQITPNGMNINTDLAFQTNNATMLRSARFSPQAAVLSGALDLGCLYVVNNELYYNDVTGGNNVQITLNGAVNATSSGIASGTASAAFSAGVLVVKASSTSGANILMQSAVLTNSGNLTNQLTLQAPALTGSSSLTLPSIPAATSFVQIDTSGNITAGQPIVNPNFSGKAVQENGNNVVVSNTNATLSLAIIRGIVSSSGPVLYGEGFSSTLTSTGVYTITYTSAFTDDATCQGTLNFGSAGMVAISNQTTTGCIVRTFSSSGTLVSTAFNFTAIGQRT